LETVTVKFDGAPTTTTAYTYDNEGRQKTETVNGVTTTYTYAKQQTTLNKNGVNTTTTFDGWGNAKQSADRMGNTVAYSYHSSGQPKTITAAGATYTMTYDNAGNQAKLVDPDAGTIQYTHYDGLGRVRQQKTAKNVLQTNTYDAWGQLTNSTLGSDATAYQYDSSKGWLTSVTGPGGHSLTYAYDTYGRPTKQTLAINGEGDFETSYDYDPKTGNIKTVTYPGNIVETRAYDANGHLDYIKAGNTTVWQLNDITATQTVTKLAGGNMTATATYNAKGFLTRLNTVKSSTNILDMDYVFNTGNGNLFSRTGMMTSTETFAYDSLYRLKGVSGPYSMAMDYAANGNITNKTGLGAYAYGANGAGPHAVTSVATNTGSVLQQDIVYTDFLRPKKITQGNYVLDIEYGPHQQRIKSELKNNSVPVKTIIFAGNYERITENGVTKEMYYIGDAIFVKQAGQSGKTLYTHKDHLGSIISITDSVGTPVFRATYDPWGKQTLNPANTFSFHRGYTGHEHLPEFELINMNARLYDPLIGRFLSPDPYVQAPTFSQSYNRYAYCLNNPLIYTDPTGEKWWKWALGAAAFLIDPISTITAVTSSAAVTATTVGVSSYATTIANTPLLFFGGAIDQDWARGRQLVTNSWRINNGLFYSDPNQNFLGQTWQLTSRFTWEGIQTHVGYGYTQFRNSIGRVSRVDFFGGATFATQENADKRDGVSLGNYININIRNRITGNFEDWVLRNPLYMHEYGHTFDSRIYGLSYLFAVGIPSLTSASRNTLIVRRDADGNDLNPNRLETHDVFWAETRANRHAERYFRRYYGINWNFPDYPLSNPF